MEDMKGLRIMTLGDLRYDTKNLPDDTEIVVDGGDLEFFEIRIRNTLAPAHGHAWALCLELGQQVNLDKDLDRRIDEYLES